MIKISGRIILERGDITHETCDAIVNAANSSLLGGGGVDGAIHWAAGQRLVEECRRIRAAQLPNGLPTGEAILTTGYDLPAHYIIHTVGPIWRGGNHREAELLAACYRSVLRIAAEYKLDTVAIPAISTGAYGFPPEPAAKIALDVMRQHLAGNEFPHTVRFVVIGGNYPIYQRLIERLLSKIDL
ncbi:MAG: O-acetyl-ADP-ribose deacetylase [bacterium]